MWTMPDPTPPEEAYLHSYEIPWEEIRKECRIRGIAPDTADAVAFGLGYRAAVDAVWPLAFAAGQAEAASLRIIHAPPRVSSIGWFRYEVLIDWEWAGEPWASGLYSYRHVVWGRRRAERLARQRP
jgi:hypothetical protein